MNDRDEAKSDYLTNHLAGKTIEKIITATDPEEIIIKFTDQTSITIGEFHDRLYVDDQDDNTLYSQLSDRYMPEAYQQAIAKEDHAKNQQAINKASQKFDDLMKRLQ